MVMIQKNQPKVETKTVAAENEWTEGLVLGTNEACSVSIVGSFTATVRMQRSFDDGVTWAYITKPLGGGTLSWTAAAEEDYMAVVPQMVRLGVPTGSYGSGNPVCTLRRAY